VIGTGVGVQINTPTAYRALFLVHGLTCLADAAALSRLPKFEPLPGAHERSPLAALKDRPFVAYTAVRRDVHAVLRADLPVAAGRPRLRWRAARD
jgi:hypothetical protein